MVYFLRSHKYHMGESSPQAMDLYYNLYYQVAIFIICMLAVLLSLHFVYHKKDASKVPKMFKRDGKYSIVFPLILSLVAGFAGVLIYRFVKMYM